MDASDAADETARLIRQQFRAFTEAEVVANAPVWHGADQLIPLELIEQLAELGVFGLTTPEEFGGSGMGKEAMCVVSEELSRGYIGVGSLGTRSEIAGRADPHAAAPRSRSARWLPRIASGDVLPTAVFTEPNTGSDLRKLTHPRRARRRRLAHHTAPRPGSPTPPAPT